MDDNISNFTEISVEKKLLYNETFAFLSLTESIYGIDEGTEIVKFYFKGENPAEYKDFIDKLSAYKLSFKQKIIQAVNWNSIWENSFPTVSVGTKWLIRAPFHPPSDNHDTEIIIAPKMAFGTGHHATTFMVLEFMSELDFQNQKVLDLGCGSGILAIASEKCGAETVLAIDYDPLSVENSIENISINACKKIIVKQGNVYQYEEGKFDIILANINKKVLTDNIQKIISLLNEDGHLVISGILEKDVSEIMDFIPHCNLVKTSKKDGWVCLLICPRF